MAYNTINPAELQCREVLISSAQITSTSAGDFGHAQGISVLPAPGAGHVTELVSAVLFYDHKTADYGGGGNVTLNWEAGGAAITGLVSAANSMAANADKLCFFVPLAAAAAVPVVNKAIHLVSTGAFTQPGTAAGVIRLKIYFRVHKTGF